MSVCARSRRWGAELGVADCDDTIETGCGFFRPGGGWTRGGRFEVWQYGGEGGVVVAFLGVNGLKIGGQEEQGRVEEAVPVKASSGRTSRSMFRGDATCKRAFARAMFSGSLPSSGLNCRQAMRMLRENLEEERTKLWICSPKTVASAGMYSIFP